MTQASLAEPVLTVDLSTPEPIPQAGIDRALELMRSGRLFRYGEAESGDDDAALLEAAFARHVGRRYAVAMSSGGAALAVALRCAGVRPGEPVLLNAFTLAPVPGAIENVGARAVLVEITEDLTVDLADLERKAAASGAKVLLASHMRGHVPDLEAVAALCERHGITLVEDCAHTLGATWNGRQTGTFGSIGCFSAQTFKHLNAGEGGILVCDDEESAVRAILFSGSYMLYAQHGARPPLEAFEALRREVPNLSLRMSALSAAVLLPQLDRLGGRIRVWNERYAAVAQALSALDGLRLPRRPTQEGFVGSSLQFSVDLEPEGIRAFVAACAERGMLVKWFGEAEPVGFTSTFADWRYLGERGELPQTASVLARLCDIRISTALAPEDCAIIGRIAALALDRARTAAGGSA